MKRRSLWAIAIVGLAVLLTGLRLAGDPMPGEVYPLMPTSHIATVDTPHEPYSTMPPTSGPHLAAEPPAPDFYETSFPFELLVHNLEHGHIVIYYDKRALEADRQELKQLVRRFPNRILVVLAPEQIDGVILTAWGRMLRLPTAERRTMERFVRAYSGRDNH